MNKTIAYTGVISAILFFLSLALAFGVLGNPTIFTMVGTGEGKQYSIVIEDDMEQEGEERTIEMELFNRADTGHVNYISPTSFGRGTIQLKNTSRYPVSYTLQFSDKNDLDIPVVFRIRDKNNELIMGTEEKWLNAAELEDITKDLKTGDRTQYIVEWSWDSHSDLDDTDIGIRANERSSYSMTVDVLSKPIGYVTNNPSLAAIADIISVVLAVFLTTAITAMTYFTVRNKKALEY